MNKEPEQAIEEYLDHLSLELHSLPPQLQSETREELRQHLHSLVVMQRDPQHVLESALRQFGDPTEIGRRLALEWEEDQWNLRGLTLLQRIDKIRDSGALEIEAANPSPLIKNLNWIQVAFLLLANQSVWLASHLSVSASHIVHFAGLGLCFVIGLVACILEWKDGMRQEPRTATQRKRMWSNILTRASMAILIPCIFLLPNQTPLFAGAMMVLGVVSIALRRSSPRARLFTKVSLVYGLLMGLASGVVVSLVINSHLKGSQSWLLLLSWPVFYCFGRWFWKRPPLRAKK